eukprot:TRINITY_DN52731_c0_g1_i1.p1 TRINITY_DN52731_c0_g1~~TRINITY_DN52731_c0_g1_i1.p1  ORF type:complete len:701 (-),score=79.88 TRINITY_DN52731_c0_g1_i1:63-2027(-)
MAGTAESIRVGKIRKSLAKPTGIAMDEQILSFRGEQLQDGQTCAEVGIDDDVTITLVRAQPQRSATPPEQPPAESFDPPPTSAPAMQENRVSATPNPTSRGMSPGQFARPGSTATGRLTAPVGHPGIPMVGGRTPYDPIPLGIASRQTSFGPADVAQAQRIPESPEARVPWWMSGVPPYGPPAGLGTPFVGGPIMATTSTSTTDINGRATGQQQQDDIVRPGQDADQAFLVHYLARDKKYRVPVVHDISMITVGQIRGYIEKSANLPADKQCLSYQGHVLTDEQTAGDLGMGDGSVIHLNVIGEVPPLPKPVKASASARSTTPTATASAHRAASPPPTTSTGQPRGGSPPNVTSATTSTVSGGLVTPVPSASAQNAQAASAQDPVESVTQAPPNPSLMSGMPPSNLPPPAYVSAEELANINQQRRIADEMRKLETEKLRLEQERLRMAAHTPPSPLHIPPPFPPGSYGSTLHFPPPQPPTPVNPATYVVPREMPRDVPNDNKLSQGYGLPGVDTGRLEEEKRLIQAERQRLVDEQRKFGNYWFGRQHDVEQKERELIEEGKRLERRQQELLQSQTPQSASPVTVDVNISTGSDEAQPQPPSHLPGQLGQALPAASYPDVQSLYPGAGGIHTPIVHHTPLHSLYAPIGRTPAQPI